MPWNRENGLLFDLGARGGTRPVEQLSQMLSSMSWLVTANDITITVMYNRCPADWSTVAPTPQLI